MNDQQTTIQELKKKIEKFMNEREWKQFHSPKNMTMAIAAEAAELMEPFLWVEGHEAKQELEKKRDAIEQEAADVAIALLTFCDENNIDLSKAIEQKLIIQAKKYPVEKAKGSRKKYTEL